MKNSLFEVHYGRVFKCEEKGCKASFTERSKLNRHMVSSNLETERYKLNRHIVRSNLETERSKLNRLMVSLIQLRNRKV